MPITLKDKFSKHKYKKGVSNVYHYIFQYNQNFHYGSAFELFIDTGKDIVKDHPKYAHLVKIQYKDEELDVTQIDVSDMEFDYFKEKIDKIIAIWELQRS